MMQLSDPTLQLHEKGWVTSQCRYKYILYHTHTHIRYTISLPGPAPKLMILDTNAQRSGSGLVLMLLSNVVWKHAYYVSPPLNRNGLPVCLTEHLKTRDLSIYNGIKLSEDLSQLNKPIHRIWFDLEDIISPRTFLTWIRENSPYPSSWSQKLGIWHESLFKFA